MRLSIDSGKPAQRNRNRSAHVVSLGSTLTKKFLDRVPRNLPQARALSCEGTVEVCDEKHSRYMRGCRVDGCFRDGGSGWRRRKAR
jgi:hypothetical protein